MKISDLGPEGADGLTAPPMMAPPIRTAETRAKRWRLRAAVAGHDNEDEDEQKGDQRFDEERPHAATTCPGWPTGSAGSPSRTRRALPLVATRPPEAPFVRPPLRSLRWL